MNILTLETTCDETAAAVVTDRLEVLGSVVASQDELHERFGGVVPEIASRAHVERILPVIDETLRRAGVCARRPRRRGRGQHARAGRLAAGRTGGGQDAVRGRWTCRWWPSITCRPTSTPAGWPAGQDVFPCVGLIVSGGHTSLYRCGEPARLRAARRHDRRRGRRGLRQGGQHARAALSRAGRRSSGRPSSGDPRAYRFPRALLDDDDRLDFSFSGLKTAVRYQIAGPGPARLRRDPTSTPQQVADLAASFQEAVVDCLVGKAMPALRADRPADAVRRRRRGGQRPAARSGCDEEAGRAGVELHIAPLRLCTDNAVMGAIAVERLKAGLVEPLDLDVYPGVVRQTG